jgi:hypothetical protein
MNNMKPTTKKPFNLVEAHKHEMNKPDPEIIKPMDGFPCDQ